MNYDDYKFGTYDSHAPQNQTLIELSFEDVMNDLPKYQAKVIQERIDMFERRLKDIQETAQYRFDQLRELKRIYEGDGLPWTGTKDQEMQKLIFESL